MYLYSLYCRWIDCKYLIKFTSMSSTRVPKLKHYINFSFSTDGYENNVLNSVTITLSPVKILLIIPLPRPCPSTRSIAALVQPGSQRPSVSLRQSRSQRRNIWVCCIDITALDKLAEPVLGIFMLEFRDQQTDDGGETVHTSTVVNLS